MQTFRNAESGRGHDDEVLHQRKDTPGAATQMERDGVLQKKAESELVLGAAGDAFEREADRAADTVLSGGTVGAISAVSSSVQRASSGSGGGDLSQVQRALDTSNGGSLSSDVQSSMEGSFGRSFSGVRVHDDSAAASAASSIGAAAFTVGQDIYFGAGRYAPETGAGQHLLAHELTHTVQQGSSGTVQRKLIQADGEKKDAAAPAPANAPVKTQWYLNFQDVFKGAGKTPDPRGKDDSLYVREFNVAPEAAQGDKKPAPTKFSGVTNTNEPQAYMGEVAHPKDQAGMMSATIGYGKRPTFDFTITTDPLGKDATKQDKADKGTIDKTAAPGTKEHAAVVAELTKAVDDFTSEAEAQDALEKILAAKFGAMNVALSCKVKLKETKVTEAPNPTSKRYSVVSAPKTFNIKVSVPNVTKDKSVGWTSTKGAKKNSGNVNTQEKGKEDEKQTKTTVETGFITSLEQSWSTELGTFTDFVAKSANVETNETKSTKTLTVQNSTAAKLAGEISGGAGLDLSKIPLAGKYLDKLLDAKLSVNLKPDLSNTFTLTHESKDEDAKKTVKENSTEVRNQLSQKVSQAGKNMWSTTLKTQVETQTHEKTTTKDTDQNSTGDEQSDTSSSTATTGSINIVASTLQPVLDEE